MNRLLRVFTLRTSTMVFFIVGVVLVSMFFARMGRDPGYVLLSYGSHTFETSMLVGVLAEIVFVVVCIIGYRILVWLFDANWRQRMANRKTIRGLVAYAEGNWQRAEKLLSRSAPNTEAPLVNYLTAAEAAHQQGKFERRDHYLMLAHETTPGVEKAVGLAKARLQLSSQQWESALATLRVLKESSKSPAYPFVLKLLSSAYAELADWGALHQLLPELDKHKVFSPQEQEDLAMRCYEGQLASAMKGFSNDEKRKNLRAAFEGLPKSFRAKAALVTACASRLLELEAHNEAEQMLSTFLRKEWDDRVIRLYGMARSTDAHKQALFAESFLKERPSNPALLLTLGRLSLLQKDWDKAQEYFLASLAARKSAEAYGEMGRLLASLGKHRESNDHFQAGLAMIAQRLPDLPLPGGEHRSLL